MAYTILEQCGQRAKADYTGNAQYTRMFRVIFDDAVNDPSLVSGLPELPQPFMSHPVDLFAMVTSVEPEQNNEDPSAWDIRIEYSRLSRDPNQSNVDPLARAIKVKWSTHKYERPFIWDINGNIVSNSAGDLFNPPEMIDDSRLVATITSNQQQVPSWLLSARDAINSSPFTLDGIAIDAECAKIQGVEVSEVQFDNNSFFRTVQIVIEVREARTANKTSVGGTNGSGATVASNQNVPGWKKAIQDAGYRYINASNKLVRVKDDAGKDASIPALLNGNGTTLLTPVAVGSEVYRVFDAYRKLDFSTLNLPP